MNGTLVIGYGNTLRKDDGVGVWIAEKIESLSLRDVDVRTCHQLHLELLPDLIQYRNIVLVDASADGEAVAYRTCSTSTALPAPTDHSVSPETLHQLGRELYDTDLTIHIFTVRGSSFEFGFGLSPEVEARAMAVVTRIVKMLVGELKPMRASEHVVS